MKDILPEIDAWVVAPTPFALATVIKTWRSAPRMAGAGMAITENMDIAGSVSGGCIEGDVIRTAQKVLASGTPQRVQYGVSNDDAWSVGLSCGGQVEVYVEPFLAFGTTEEQELWQAQRQAIQNNAGCVLVTNMTATASRHTLLYADGKILGQSLSNEVLAQAKQAYQHSNNQIISHEEVDYFIHVFPAKDRLLIIGAAHLTVDLVRLAHLFDFETTVIDPRGIFSTKMKFAVEPHALYEKWPAEALEDLTLDAHTYAVVLSHDPKIDDQALHILLPSKVAYIGALGSRKTQAKRIKRLEEAGFSAEDIGRIHGPVGIDINARRPREIALSIMGELVQVKNRFL